jgi:hypothetical protein
MYRESARVLTCVRDEHNPARGRNRPFADLLMIVMHWVERKVG